MADEPRNESYEETSEIEEILYSVVRKTGIFPREIVSYFAVGKSAEEVARETNSETEYIRRCYILLNKIAEELQIDLIKKTRSVN